MAMVPTSNDSEAWSESIDLLIRCQTRGAMLRVYWI